MSYFQAGKALIQTNVMPVFTKLDTSLKGRLVVINFLDTLKNNPDPFNTSEKLVDVSLKN